MLTPMLHIDVIVHLLERQEETDTKATGKELPLVHVGVSPFFSKSGSTSARSVMESFKMFEEIGLSGVAFRLFVLSVAFRDLMDSEMFSIGVWCVAEAAS